MEEMKFGYQKVNKEKLIEDLFESPYLSNFFIDNDLTSDVVEEHLLTFMNYNIEKTRCLECDGLKSCTQDNTGLEPVIEFVENKVVSSYTECPFLRSRKLREQQDKNIDAMHLPSSIFEASLDDIDFQRGKNKVEILNKMTNFITLYKNGEQVKGMYLWGRYGVGKTYLLSALANELIKNDIKVSIAYYPDLVREFKSKISDSNASIEDAISKLKQVEVLMLDDIGGEGTSVWVRDEILGPILQYRLLDHKPTFFTSNLNIKSLVEAHFANFTNSKAVIRAARIGTRIKNLVGDNEIEM
jgi:primosomal protein DnaI